MLRSQAILPLVDADRAHPKCSKCETTEADTLGSKLCIVCRLILTHMTRWVDDKTKAQVVGITV